MSYTGKLNRSISVKVFTLYLLIAPLMAIFPGFPGVFAGFTLGVVFSILNLKLLSLALEKAVAMNPKNAAEYVVSRYLARYFLAAAVLVLSLKSDYINVIGTIFGLLLIKFVILVNNIFDTKLKRMAN
jgi:hypothetical protein